MTAMRCLSPFFNGLLGWRVKSKSYTTSRLRPKTEIVARQSSAGGLHCQTLYQPQRTTSSNWSAMEMCHCSERQISSTIHEGNRFSTYATWAIMKNFARTLRDAARHRDRFCTNNSEMFNYTEDTHTDQNEQESSQIKRESQVEGILECLDERERQIVTARFGLTRGHEPLTLAQHRICDGGNQRANPADPASSDG